MENEQRYFIIAHIKNQYHQKKFKQRCISVASKYSKYLLNNSSFSDCRSRFKKVLKFETDKT